MQRKPNFPVSNCSIKMPDSKPVAEGLQEEEEPMQRRQQLINFGHAQWGFNNWNWAVTKQDLDFVEMSNGKYVAGVVAFVSVTVKSFDIHRENIGYATSSAPYKGAAIHNARKCAVTNALRETLLSFGGTVATELLELMDAHRADLANHIADPVQENNQNAANKHVEPKIVKKEEAPVGGGKVSLAPLKSAVINPPPVAKAHPMPVNLPSSTNRPPPINPPRPPQVHPPQPTPPAPVVRPNSNVSFVFQPVMGGVVPPLYGGPPRFVPPPPPPHMFPNYYEYSGPWHFTYEPFDRHHGNVNLNFNMPPKNLVVNSRGGSVECKGREGCWIKPTIFYDGFWTEQKVKKWVAEQVEKQFPDEANKSTQPPESAAPNP